MIAAAGLLRAVPLWAWAVAALVAWGGINKIRADRAAEGREKAEAAAELAREAQRGTAAALTETTRRVTAQAKEARHAADRQARDRADAAAADGAGLRVRDFAAGLAARAGAADPAAAGDRADAADAARMLAQLLERADARAGLLARVADERGRALEACTGSYDALTGAGPAP